MKILDLTQYEEQDLNFKRDKDLVDLIHSLPPGDKKIDPKLLEYMASFDYVIYSGHSVIVSLFLNYNINLLFPLFKKEKGAKRRLVGFFDRNGKFIFKEDLKEVVK